MLGSFKHKLYGAAKGLGFFNAALNSAWRQNRLAILCYHGISLADEHDWRPGLYLTQERFGQRLEALRRLNCNVLPLGPALKQLQAGNLPPRSVVITFDDGFYDFFLKAVPLLRDFAMPATVYMTTYYSAYNRPIANLTMAYLLWKSSGVTLDWPEVLDAPVTLSAAVNDRLWQTLIQQSNELPAPEKDAFVARLAERLGVDYAGICAQRLFTLMNPAEVREMAAAGIDIQLHTHRHRVPLEKELLEREIADNRKALAPLQELVHFCYPSGVYHANSGEVLRGCQVLSATTCDPGLATASSAPHYLPRYLDAMNITDLNFEAWVSGASMLLPHRNAVYGNGR